MKTKVVSLRVPLPYYLALMRLAKEKRTTIATLLREIVIREMIKVNAKEVVME